LWIFLTLKTPHIHIHSCNRRLVSFYVYTVPCITKSNIINEIKKNMTKMFFFLSFAFSFFGRIKQWSLLQSRACFSFRSKMCSFFLSVRICNFYLVDLEFIEFMSNFKRIFYKISWISNPGPRAECSAKISMFFIFLNFCRLFPFFFSFCPYIYLRNGGNPFNIFCFVHISIFKRYSIVIEKCRKISFSRFDTQLLDF
jgi:hypothetical protein